MTPLEAATLFHDTYERLAPSFSYETRPDTKAFDPDSPNGRLMQAVCAEVIAALSQPTSGDADPLQSYEKFDGIGPHDETIETRARIGERYLECYASALDDPRLKGYTPADCPSELLLDMLNTWEPAGAAVSQEAHVALQDCVDLLDRHVPNPARNGQINRAKAILARASGDAGEPVAYRYDKHGQIEFSPNRQHPLFGWTETPLFAHPRTEAPTPVEQDAVERGICPHGQPGTVNCPAVDTALPTDPVNQGLVEALEQAEETLDQILDDMRGDGRCVCLAVKNEAIETLAEVRAALTKGDHHAS